MNTLWIATRKGAFALQQSAQQTWRLSGPQFLGHIVHHIVHDPRDPGVLLMAARTGHLGPTVYRSIDGGRQWKEATQPPAFRKSEGEAGRAVERVFWLTPGHASEQGVWYAGSSPAGLFRSEDGGVSWSPVAGFNDHPMRPQWAPGAQSTPDGELMHSILIDPRDARHLYIGISSGGVFESMDAGADWTPLNEGCEANFLPEPDPVFGHDPHCVVMHPLQPDRLYQQNHCGVYRIDRPSRRWTRIGDNMPRAVGDIGFPIVMHPRLPDTAWVFPMDGAEVWPRTSVDGRPAVYVTRDAGATWRRQDQGLPESQAWFTVLRQAMCADASDPPGLYFGTTCGEVWASRNAGESWICIAKHLPEIYGVSVSE